MAAPRVDRKLAAIMAVDVVGYSRLIGADEAGTLARVKAHRKELAGPLIAEHRGRMVKLTGDGALVEFGSVVDAVECAVAIQNGMAEREAAEPEARRIRFRIGINIGDIVLEDGDIFGDGVNVAARLEGLAEPGGICIARNVHNQVKGKLDLAFEPMGEHQVRNITEPITVYRVRPGPGGWAKPRPAARASLLLSDKPSIAVLRFENFSDDPKQARLADGITEDIITDLSRFRDLFVVARSSTFVYKDKPTDVRQIARELGVQYVLEGSLQTDGKRVRITAQLIDATTGNHVWSERYDRPLDDIFAVQGEVTQTIAASLAGQYGGMARAGREVARRKPPENLQAYEYYLLGLEVKHRFTKEDNKKAQELFGRALDLDPNFARAYVGLAWTHNLEIKFGWADSWQQSMDNWFVASKAALAADHLDAEAHLTLGLCHLCLNNFAHGLAEVERALALNPNNADVLAVAGGGMLPWLGRPEQGAELVERAVRINPLHPEWYLYRIRDASFYARRYSMVIAATDKKTTLDRWDHLYRALSFAQLGEAKEVSREATVLLEAYPDYSAEKYLSETGTFARETELNLWLDSHRKAGLPVCATEAQLAKYPEMKRLEQCEQQRASG